VVAAALAVLTQAPYSVAAAVVVAHQSKRLL
jgi:hypothetical protein